MGADLEGAELQDVKLRASNLHRINLSEAELNFASLQGSILQGANLQEADLRHADLRHVYFINTDLRGADLRGADLRGAVFPYLRLQDVRIRKKFPGWRDIEEMDLQEINLRDAKWEMTQLDGVKVNHRTQMNTALRDFLLSRQPRLKEKVSSSVW